MIRLLERQHWSKNEKLWFGHLRLFFAAFHILLHTLLANEGSGDKIQVTLASRSDLASTIDSDREMEKESQKPTGEQIEKWSMKRIKVRFLVSNVPMSVLLDETHLLEVLENVADDGAGGRALTNGGRSFTAGRSKNALIVANTMTGNQVDTASDGGGTDVVPIVVKRGELLVGGGLDVVDPRGKGNLASLLEVGSVGRNELGRSNVLDSSSLRHDARRKEPKKKLRRSAILIDSRFSNKSTRIAPNRRVFAIGKHIPRPCT